MEGTIIACVLGGVSTALSSLGLWILSDMRDRIVRLENLVLNSRANAATAGGD